MDDDALDAARERRGGGAARRRLRAGADRRRDRLRGAEPARRTCRCKGKRGGHGQGLRAGRAARTPGRSTSCAAQEGVEHRVVAWDEVSMEEGTGIVHIAPGCGAEDFELGRREGLATIVPVDESGAFYDGFGWLHGRHTADAAQQIVEDLGQRGRLVDAGEITHRYPVCWRCGTELIYRLVDEWFIRCDELREPMIDAARRRGVDAGAVRQADGGLAAQHGRLVHQPQALLGPAAAVLLLPGRPHDRGRLARGAGRARAARPGRGRGAAPALDRRGGDRLRRVRRRGPAAARRRRLLAGRRHHPVLDAGLAERTRSSSAATPPAPARV